jgi:hypothetical protein
MNLAKSRELKQLKDEYKDIIVDTTPKPVKHQSALPPPPSPEGGGRVNPTEGGGTTQPTVKPDEQKAPQPKKGGNK